MINSIIGIIAILGSFIFLLYWHLKKIEFPRDPMLDEIEKQNCRDYKDGIRYLICGFCKTNYGECKNNSFPLYCPKCGTENLYLTISSTSNQQNFGDVTKE